VSCLEQAASASRASSPSVKERKFKFPWIELGSGGGKDRGARQFGT
jgi:hypothetical protein